MATQVPTAMPLLQKLYHQFMAGNQEAFGAEAYSVASHALMAALHCAQTLDDVPKLEEIEHVALQQLAVIDTQHPEYEHSTSAAKTRGHVSIFTTLAQQAKTRSQIVQREAQDPSHSSLA